MSRRVVGFLLAFALVTSPALAQQLRGAQQSRLGTSVAWVGERLAVSSADAIYVVEPSTLPADAPIDDVAAPQLRTPHEQMVALPSPHGDVLAVLRRGDMGEAFIDLVPLNHLDPEAPFDEQVGASLHIDDLPVLCGGDGEQPCVLLRATDDRDGDGRMDLELARPDLGQLLFVATPPLDGGVHDALLMEIEAIDAPEDALQRREPIATQGGAVAYGRPELDSDAGLVFIEIAHHEQDDHDHGDDPDRLPDPDAMETESTHIFDLARNLLQLSPQDLASANPGATTVTTLPTSAFATETLDGDSIADLLTNAAGSELVIDGRFSHSIPLEVPGGRGDFGPSLAITFADGRFDPWLGHHWTLSGFSRIERHGPLGGAPTGDDALDTFTVDGQKLIEGPQTGGLRSFRTEQATPRAYRFDTQANRWEATGGGFTRIFGVVSTHGAIEDGPGTQSEADLTHVWWLAQDLDDHDNDVVYDYERPSHQFGIRPTRVAWGTAHMGAPSTNHTPDLRNFELQFAWDGPALADVRASAGQVNLDGDALSAIELVGSEDPATQLHQRLRSWELNYTGLQPTTRPAIGTITLRGAPDAANPAGPTLPIRTFTYTPDRRSLDLAPPIYSVGAQTEWGTLPFADPSLAGDGQIIRFARLNHDALPDVLVFDIDEAWKDSKPPVCEEDGCPTTPASNACLPANNVVCYEPGDGPWDGVCAEPAHVRAFVNHGSFDFIEDTAAAGFIQTWLNEQGPPRSGLDDLLGRVRFVDVNGDGMDDLLGSDSSFLSVSNADWSSANPAPQPGVHGIAGAQLVDLDGDGRPELVTAPHDRTEDIPANEENAGGLCVVPPRDGAGWEGFNHPVWSVRWNRSDGQALEFTDFEPLPDMPFFGGIYTEGLVHNGMDTIVAPLPTGPAGEQTQCTAHGADGTLIPTETLATLDHDVTGLFVAGSGWTWLAQHLRFNDVNADGCADVTMSMDATPLLLNGASDLVSPHALELFDTFASEVFYGDCVGGFEAPAEFSGWSTDLGWPSLRIRQSAPAPTAQSCTDLPFNGLRISRSCDADQDVEFWARSRCESDPQSICCDGAAPLSCSGLYAVCENWSCSDQAYQGDGDPPGWGTWSATAEYWGTETVPTFNYDEYPNVEPFDPLLRHLWELGIEERRPGASATPTPGGMHQDLDGDGVPELLQVCVADGAAPGTPDAATGSPPGDPVGDYPLVAYQRRGWFDNGVQEDAACDGARFATLADVSWLGQLTDRGLGAGFPHSRMENRGSRLGPDRASMFLDLDGDGFADHVRVDAGAWTVRRNQRVVKAGALKHIGYPTGGQSTLVWRSGDPLANPLLPFAERGIVEIVDAQGHRVFGRAGCRLDGRFTGCQTVVEQSHRGAVRQTRHATRREAAGQGYLMATWSADGRLEATAVSLPADPDRIGIDTTAPWAHPAWRSCSTAWGEGSHDASLLTPQQVCVIAPDDAISGPASGMAHHHELVGQTVFAFPNHAGLLGANIAIPGFVPQTGGSLAHTRLRVTETDTAGEPWLEVETSWSRGDVTRTDDDLRTELISTSVPRHGPKVTEQITTAPGTGLLVGHAVIGHAGFTPTNTTQLDAAGNSITTSMALDPFGRPDAVTDPDTNVSQLDWSWCGGVAERVDPLGNTTSRSVDALCRPNGTTASNGLVVDTIHGGFGPEVTWTFPDAGQPPLTSISYRDHDASHLRDPSFPRSAQSDGRTASFTWIDHRGLVTRTATCALGGPVPAPSMALPADVLSSCAPGTRVQSDTLWSTDGLRIASSEPYVPTLAGGVTIPQPLVWSRADHDSLGRPVQTAVVRGLESEARSGVGLTTLSSTQHVRYLDGSGVIGPDGIERRSVVEPLEQIALRDGQQVARTALRVDGKALLSEDIGGRTTTWGYDGFGRLETTTGHPWMGVDGGQITTVQPTATVTRTDAGLVTDTLDPANATWSVIHDALGRPTTSFDPDNNPVTTLFEDAQRRTTTSIPERDDIVEHTDALGRPVLRELGGDLFEQIQYDGWGGVLQTTDAAGVTRSGSLAFLPGGVTRIGSSDPAGTAWVFTGPGGRVLRQVDADGVAVDVEYDEWGRSVRTRTGASIPWTSRATRRATSSKSTATTRCPDRPGAAPAGCSPVSCARRPRTTASAASMPGTSASIRRTCCCRRPARSPA